MIAEDRQKLRAAALAAIAATPSRTSVQAVLGRWELQTSNSFRRIGCHGDGDVLCAITQRSDGQPDLLAPSGVLAYVVAAQPRVVIDLLDELDRCEDTLRLSRKHHEQDHDALETKHAEVKVLCDQLEEVAGTVAALGTAVAQLGSDDPDAVATALALVDQLATALRTRATKGNG